MTFLHLCAPPLLLSRCLSHGAGVYHLAEDEGEQKPCGGGQRNPALEAPEEPGGAGQKEGEASGRSWDLREKGHWGISKGGVVEGELCGSRVVVRQATVVGVDLGSSGQVAGGVDGLKWSWRSAE